MLDSVDTKRVAKFISSVRWRESVQYKKKAPHEYTVKDHISDPELLKEFEWFVKFIRLKGYDENFFTTKFTYLDFNGHKYWTMGDPIEKTVIINRALL